MNPDEIDLADDDLRDTHGRSREDFEADRADDRIKMLKESGEYEGWSRRLELEALAAYERDRRLFGEEK